MAEQRLYERLGSVYAITAVVEGFRTRFEKNPKIVNATPELRE